MNRHAALSVVAGVAALCLTPAPGRADSSQLSPERLEMVDKMGDFPPAFKAAVHNLVDTKHALEQAQAEKTKLTRDLPDLQQKATEAEAKTASLRQELAKYDHPEETDFVALRNRMNDAGAKLEEQIALAQSYVWTYPASPHQSEAQQFLQQTQKKLADQRQAEKEALEARVAARAKLVQRAQARDLNLNEWRDFLRDMSQDDLVRLLGRPTSRTSDYWIYSGGWIADPATSQKAGMEINFNAGRVISVVKEPPSTP